MFQKKKTHKIWTQILKTIWFDRDKKEFGPEMLSWEKAVAEQAGKYIPTSGAM